MYFDRKKKHIRLLLDVLPNNFWVQNVNCKIILQLKISYVVILSLWHQQKCQKQHIPTE